MWVLFPLAACLEAPQVWDECDLDVTNYTDNICAPCASDDECVYHGLPCDGTIFCVNEASGMLQDTDDECYDPDARYAWPDDSTCRCVDGRCASDVATSG